MNSIALRMMFLEEEQHGNGSQNPGKRNIRDISNPLELPNSAFEKCYRVNKPAFQYLLHILTTDSQPTQQCFAVPPIVKLSAVLRFFAQGGCLAEFGKDTDVSLAQPSFSKILADVVETFEMSLCGNWIRLSHTVDEKSNVASVLYRKYGIPNVMGCVDGVHVRIVSPTRGTHLYYDRDGRYSLNVMLVCDHNNRVQYVDACSPGSCRDSFIWKASDLRSHLKKEYLNGNNKFWLLGDGAYPLEPWLLTPYRTVDEGSAEMKFNKAHAKCRNEMNRTVRMLKKRFNCILGSRELYYAPSKAAKIMNLCCALHNVCIFYKSNVYVKNGTVSTNRNIYDISANSSTSPQYLNAAKVIRDNIASSM